MDGGRDRWVDGRKDRERQVRRDECRGRGMERQTDGGMDGGIDRLPTPIPTPAMSALPQEMV